ncbi:brain and acute leukemia cytoplasmic protein [Petromyzon marinus]|uniref:Brain and acute leukemia cytoplasmic protein n=1 Tax=Petromyzon marinus TaxID=7757 RepID=A0AAJ7TJC6_PETMA|nr:brain and acute leukemia cytoplasmic protein [Petromyzon marinus]
MGCGGSKADAIEPRYHESWTKETESTWLTGTESEVPLSAIPAAPGSLDAASCADSGDGGSLSLMSAGIFDDGLAYPAQAYVTMSQSEHLHEATGPRDSALENADASTPEDPSPATGEGSRRPSEPPVGGAATTGEAAAAVAAEAVGGSPERSSLSVELFPATRTHAHHASTGAEITTLEKKSVIRTEETKWQANRMSTKQVTITITKSIRQIGKSGRKPEATAACATKLQTSKAGPVN